MQSTRPIRKPFSFRGCLLYCFNRELNPGPLRESLVLYPLGWPEAGESDEGGQPKGDGEGGWPMQLAKCDAIFMDFI